MLKIQTPATTANLGLGFDSMGLALDLYLVIEAEEADQWTFTYGDDFLQDLPKDETNILAESARQVAASYGKLMPPMAIHMTSDIPLAHGLGSSSSAIVAGVLLADRVLQLGLTEAEKIHWATRIEGHPDNVGPCVTGGGFVGVYEDGRLVYKTFRLDDIALIVTIPPYELLTEEVRQALPESYSKRDAVFQNAASSVLVLALLEKDYETMGHLMMEDRFHEPYRGPLIKEYTGVRQRALEAGAYATVISGAGPTLLTLAPEDRAKDILQALEEDFDHCDHRQVAVHYN